MFVFLRTVMTVKWFIELFRLKIGDLNMSAIEKSSIGK